MASPATVSRDPVDSSGRSPEPAAADIGALRRAELSSFLRSRRERILPAQVGVPLGGRRRTPGLRREEVAQLAGVGVTWYTWLEQGRDIHVSEQVLSAISRTLMLDRDERAHLFTLAGHAEHPVPRECATLPVPILRMVQQLSPYPACVQNGKYDLLAWNPVYAKLIIDIDALAPEQQNCMWLAFTEPRWRQALPEWEEGVARMVAQLRAQMAEHVGDPSWKAMLRRLRAASPEFVELWDRHEVSAPTTAIKRIRNARVGLLKFEPVSTWIGPRAGLRLLTYTPADPETARRVAQLAELIERDGARAANG